MSIGIYIDGGFLNFVQRYLDEIDGRRIDVAALCDAFGARLGGPVSELHYVRGRVVSNPTPMDWGLESAGAVRHDVPVTWGREMAADVTLALVAYEAARSGRVGTVVLFSADGDLAPAARWAAEAGARVVVPELDVPQPGRQDPSERLKTSRYLLGESHAALDLVDVLTADVDGLAPVLAGGATGGDTGGRDVMRGRIARVVDGGAYAYVDDVQGQRWFVSGAPLPGEVREVELALGARVAFRPGHHENGKRFPRAFSLRPDEGPSMAAIAREVNEGSTKLQEGTR